jgi:hypothetical protein
LLPDGSRTDVVPGKVATSHHAKSLDKAGSCAAGNNALVVTDRSGRREAPRVKFAERIF